MNTKLLYSQIKASINCQDQLVFSYNKGKDAKDGEDRIVRFVTPLEFVANAKVDQLVGDGDIKVFCRQHLPEDGFRYFFLEKIEDFRRVITREAFMEEDAVSSDKVNSDEV